MSRRRVPLSLVCLNLWVPCLPGARLGKASALPLGPRENLVAHTIPAWGGSKNWGWRGWGGQRECGKANYLNIPHYAVPSLLQACPFLLPLSRLRGVFKFLTSFTAQSNSADPTPARARKYGCPLPGPPTLEIFWASCLYRPQFSDLENRTNETYLIGLVWRWNEINHSNISVIIFIYKICDISTISLEKYLEGYNIRMVTVIISLFPFLYVFPYLSISIFIHSFHRYLLRQALC